MIDENWSEEVWIEAQINELAAAIARNHRAIEHLNQADRVIQNIETRMNKITLVQDERIRGLTAVSQKIELLMDQVVTRQDRPV